MNKSRRPQPIFNRILKTGGPHGVFADRNKEVSIGLRSLKVIRWREQRVPAELLRRSTMSVVKEENVVKLSAGPRDVENNFPVAAGAPEYELG
jgi:hypothetical protein